MPKVSPKMDQWTADYVKSRGLDMTVDEALYLYYCHGARLPLHPRFYAWTVVMGWPECYAYTFQHGGVEGNFWQDAFMNCKSFIDRIPALEKIHQAGLGKKIVTLRHCDNPFNLP